jgi:hypothetical protein
VAFALAAMNGFYPETGALKDWNAAYYRLEDYLRAHSVLSKIHQSQIILRLLQRAAQRHKLDPMQDPVRLAIEEACTEVDCWFRRIYPNEDLPSTRLSQVGRVSLYILDAAERWPETFLADGELPADFLQAMRETLVQSGPDLRVSTMVPRLPDNNPASETLQDAWRKLGQLFAAWLTLSVIGGGAMGFL